MAFRSGSSGLFRCSQVVDRTINLLKWPVAVVAVYLLPRCALAVLELLRQLVASPVAAFPLLAGLLGFLAVWAPFFRHRPFGTFFSTLEHELTHALFAILTLHRVTGIATSWNRGGRMSFRGEGNWLIAVAPYFFPTSAVAALIVSLFVDERWADVAEAALGIALGYHLTSTAQETHRHQTDLKLVGWPFALLFLPTANLIAFGALLSFALSGSVGLTAFLGELK